MSQNLLDMDDGEPSARLAQLISEISEETSCASWEDGIEYEAWGWVLRAPTAPFNRLGWGPDVQPEEVATMRRYSEMCGGWVHWPRRDDGGPVADGVQFVTMAEWLKLYEAQHVLGRHRAAALDALSGGTGLWKGSQGEFDRVARLLADIEKPLADIRKMRGIQDVRLVLEAERERLSGGSSNQLNDEVCAAVSAVLKLLGAPA